MRKKGLVKNWEDECFLRLQEGNKELCKMLNDQIGDNQMNTNQTKKKFIYVMHKNCRNTRVAKRNMQKEHISSYIRYIPDGNDITQEFAKDIYKDWIKISYKTGREIFNLSLMQTVKDYGLRAFISRTCLE